MDTVTLSQLAIETGLNMSDLRVHLSIGEELGRSPEQVIDAIRSWKTHQGRMREPSPDTRILR